MMITSYNSLDDMGKNEYQFGLKRFDSLGVIGI